MKKIIVDILLVLFVISIFASVLYGMYSWISSDNNKLNICAKEYGFEERANLAGGSSLVEYKFKSLNETTFACCLEQDYLLNGEIRNWNCTSLHDKGEVYLK